MVVLTLSACAPQFPPRGGSVDLAGAPIACPDFRAARVDAPWDVLREPALPAQTTPLGCSTDRALRVMVADPADLAGGETGPARSMSAGPAVGRYADGAVKQPPTISTLAGDS
jgi:type IV pilus biogenesis protein CpaD/CtpE